MNPYFFMVFTEVHLQMFFLLWREGTKGRGNVLLERADLSVDYIIRVPYSQFSE